MTRKILFSAILAFIASIAVCQDVNPLKVSNYSGITFLDFDKDGNAYMIGSVKGNVWINGKQSDNNFSSTQIVLAGLNHDYTFRWLLPLNTYPRDIKLFGDELYILDKISNCDDESETNCFVLEIYDLNGKLKEKRELSLNPGIPSGLTQFRLLENGIFTWTAWEDDNNQLVYNNEKHVKTKYCQLILSLKDFYGNEKWTYKIEGGIDSYTRIWVFGAKQDKDSNLYLAAKYGQSADLGIARFSTKAIYPEMKKDPLYYNGLFLMKFNPQGIPLQAKSIGENDINVIDFMLDNDGSCYFIGYHKGNDLYAKKQSDGRPYKGARILNKTFEYSEKMSNYEPTDDGFVFKLDNNWELGWMHNICGKGYNHVNEIIKTKNGFAVSGNYRHTIKIGDELFQEDDNAEHYGVGFYFEFDTDGKISNAQVFAGDKMRYARVFSNGDNPVLVVNTAATVKIKGKEFKGFGSNGGSFIYRP